jgi:hypothetical protein
MKFKKVGNDFIVLTIQSSSGCNTFKLDTNSYHFWLLTSGKLWWKIEHKEGINRVEEIEGTASYAEYWNQKGETIIPHITEYLNYLINN